MIQDKIEEWKKNSSKYRIYIYGAGLYGRNAFFFLKENNLEIEAFIVTLNDKEDTLLNKKIININQYILEYNLKETSDVKDIIIVAVSELYVKQIEEKLQEKRICNYVVLSEADMLYMMQNVKFDVQGIFLKKNIAVLLYHRVISSSYNYWKLNIAPQIFDAQMEYISKNYQVLRLDENWDEIIKENEKYIVITFDDGYVDNYKYALPILEKYRIPATIFISTDLIDTRGMYWWDELEKIFLIDEFRGSFYFQGVEYSIFTESEAKKTCTDIRNILKSLIPTERERQLEIIRNNCGKKKAETDELRCVSSEEIREMVKSSYISIGAHTKSHLSMGDNKSYELLQQEIKESKEKLESILERKVTTFAYPFGEDEDICVLAEEVLKSNGIEKSVIVKADNTNTKTDKYKIPRHVMLETENIKYELDKIWGIYG